MEIADSELFVMFKSKEQNSLSVAFAKRNSKPVYYERAGQATCKPDLRFKNSSTWSGILGSRFWSQIVTWD